MERIGSTVAELFGTLVDGLDRLASDSGNGERGGLQCGSA
jgi:hypothetical protein